MTAGEDAMREAMRFEQARIYGHTCPENRQAEPAAEPQLFARPDDSYYGPAPAPVLADLVDALDGDGPRLRVTAGSRRTLEQAIARGLNDADASAEAGVELASAARVRAAMDRISA